MATGGFFENAWTSLTSPLETTEQIGEYLGGAALTVEEGAATTGGVTGGGGQGVSAANIAGYQSTAQKQAQVQQETSELVQAGADPTQAATQAQQDVTAVYTQAGTDPTQNPFNLDNYPNLPDYAAFGLAALAGIALLQLPVIGKYGWILVAAGVLGIFGEYEGYWKLGLSSTATQTSGSS